MSLKPAEPLRQPNSHLGSKGTATSSNASGDRGSSVSAVTSHEGLTWGCDWRGGLSRRHSSLWRAAFAASCRLVLPSRDKAPTMLAMLGGVSCMIEKTRLVSRD